MKKFYPGGVVHTENKHGEKIAWVIVSNRLAKLIDKKDSDWQFSWFRLKRFSLFNGSYSAVMMSSTGLVMLIKNCDDSHFRRIDDLSALMDLFINKNSELSFMDLIKFSEERGLNIDFKFK